MRPACGTQISVRTHDMKRIPQMNTRIFTTGALACAVFLAGAAQAAAQAAGPDPPVYFDFPAHQAVVVWG